MGKGPGYIKKEVWMGSVNGLVDERRGSGMMECCREREELSTLPGPLEVNPLPLHLLEGQSHPL